MAREAKKKPKENEEDTLHIASYLLLLQSICKLIFLTEEWKEREALKTKLWLSL